MTEAQWLSCNDPYALRELTHIREKSRKIRLLGCACCRRIWHLLDDERSRVAVEVTERFADGQATGEELEQARHGANLAKQRHKRRIGGATRPDPQHQAAEACWSLAGAKAFDSTDSTLTYASHTARWDPAAMWVRYDGEKAEQATLVRDIFGNPFRPVAFSPARRTDTALSLARQMYESRDFGTMPILADALQDAGCDNEDILNHCRDVSAPHARGCWVVDLVLGKE